MSGADRTVKRRDGWGTRSLVGLRQVAGVVLLMGPTWRAGLASRAAAGAERGGAERGGVEPGRRQSWRWAGSRAGPGPGRAGTEPGLRPGAGAGRQSGRWGPKVTLGPLLGA